MGKCSRCEQLPEPLRHDGVLYVAPPHEPAGRHFEHYFRNEGVAISEPHPGMLAIPIEGDLLQRICNECFDKLSELEKADTRCLIMEDGQQPTILELTQMQSLDTLLARVNGEWLFGLIGEERLLSFFQPIVHCDDPENVFAYECLLRGIDADGSIIPAGRIFQHARSANVLFQLDRAARLTAIRDAKKHQIQERLFINFNPTAVYEARFCLQSTVAAIKEADITPANVVFEVVESDDVKDKAHLLDILKYYRDHGFRVALDDLGAGYSSLNLLHHLRPDYIKLDMELIRDCDKDPYKAHIASNLLQLAQNLGVETIAEGVETEGEWQWLRENGAHYVQGYFFAKPGAEPPMPEVPARA